MRAACDNQNIGYDQGQRLDIIIQLRKYGSLGGITVRELHHRIELILCPMICTVILRHQLLKLFQISAEICFRLCRRYHHSQGIRRWRQRHLERRRFRSEARGRTRTDGILGEPQGTRPARILLRCSTRGLANCSQPQSLL